MSTPELRDYIKKARGSNIGDSDIKEALLRVGWNEELVSKELSGASATPGAPVALTNTPGKELPENFLQQQPAVQAAPSSYASATPSLSSDLFASEPALAVRSITSEAPVGITPSSDFTYGAQSHPAAKKKGSNTTVFLGLGIFLVIIAVGALLYGSQKGDNGSGINFGNESQPVEVVQTQPVASAQDLKIAELQAQVSEFKVASSALIDALYTGKFNDNYSAAFSGDKGIKEPVSYASCADLDFPAIANIQISNTSTNSMNPVSPPIAVSWEACNLGEDEEIHWKLIGPYLDVSEAPTIVAANTASASISVKWAAPVLVDYEYTLIGACESCENNYVQESIRFNHQNLK